MGISPLRRQNIYLSGGFRKVKLTADNVIELANAAIDDARYGAIEFGINTVAIIILFKDCQLDSTIGQQRI